MARGSLRLAPSHCHAIQAGLAELPTDAYLNLLYGSFLIDVKCLPPAGFMQVQVRPG